MRKIITVGNIWFYLMMVLLLLISSCGDDVSSVEDRDNQDGSNRSDTTKKITTPEPMSLKEEVSGTQEVQGGSVVSVEKMNTKFYEFLDRNPSLDVQFCVYHQGKNKMDESIFKYSVFEKNDSSIFLTKNNDSGINTSIQIVFDNIDQWHKLISIMSTHQDQFYVTTGSYKIRDKTYETLKFKEVPAEFLIGFISKFYLTQEEFQPDKLIPNYQSSKLSYPIKLYLMLKDIDYYNQLTSKGYLSSRLDELEKKTQSMVKLVDQATTEIQGKIDRLQDIVHQLNDKISHNIKAAKEKRKDIDTTPIVPSEELVSFPPSLQHLSPPLNNVTNGNISLSDSSTIADTWLKLGGSSWLKDPKEKIDSILHDGIDNYIEGLNQESTEETINTIKGSFLFDTTLEVLKESGVPVNIEIKYRFPTDSEQLEPVFTADSFTLSVK